MLRLVDECVKNDHRGVSEDGAGAGPPPQRAAGGGAERGGGASFARRPTTPPPGTRPVSLAEPQGPQERILQRTVEQFVDLAPKVQILDAPVPQLVEQLADVLKIVVSWLVFQPKFMYMFRFRLRVRLRLRLRSSVNVCAGVIVSVNVIVTACLIPSVTVSVRVRVRVENVVDYIARKHAKHMLSFRLHFFPFSMYSWLSKELLWTCRLPRSRCFQLSRGRARLSLLPWLSRDSLA